MNVLVIQLRQLGDILLTTPVVRALKEHSPEATIDFLTYPMGRLIVPGNPMIHRHIIAPQKGVVESLRFVRDIQKRRYDVVIDFMATPRSALMARLVKAKRRVSFATGRKRLFTDIVPRMSEPEYIVRQKFRLLAPLGIVSDDVRLMLPWDESDQGVGKLFFVDHPYLAESKRRVVLSPTHRREERRWSKDSWASLARKLEQEHNATVIWAWGPGEETEVLEIHKLAHGAGTMAPATSFRELAALIANCDLFIGNSNGPSHTAVAVNTPSIQLHGPTLAVSWSPLTNRHRAIQCETMDAIHPGVVEKLIADMWPLVDKDAQALRAVGAITNAQDVWRERPNL